MADIDRLAEHIHFDIVPGSQTLYEASEWLYRLQPFIVGGCLIAAGTAIAYYWLTTTTILAFALVCLATRSPNRIWSFLSRYRPRSSYVGHIELPQGSGSTRLAMRATKHQTQYVLSATCAPFVPFIVRTSQRDFQEVNADRKMDSIAWAIISVAGVACMLMWLIFHSPTRIILGILLASGIFEYGIRAVGGCCVRVCPGRLVLLKGKLFKPNWHIQKSISLADASITADLKKGRLEITHDDDRVVINLWSVERPVALVIHVYVAAVTKEVYLACCQGEEECDIKKE